MILKFFFTMSHSGSRFVNFRYFDLPFQFSCWHSRAIPGSMLEAKLGPGQFGGLSTFVALRMCAIFF